MKKQLLKFLAFLLVLAGIASSCHPECPDCPTPNEYPKDIAFTEYLLLDTHCQWANLPYNEKVLIINSTEELEKYISCTEGSYPEVDFSKHSLLLASGKTNKEVDNVVVKKLTQVSADSYQLSIDIALDYEAFYGNSFPYNIALLVKKIDREGIIELHATLIDPKIIYPATITNKDILDFFNYATHKGFAYPSSPYFFRTMPDNIDTCLVINSRNELEQACEASAHWALPDIDFEIYTLLIGRHRVYDRDLQIVNQKIFENSVFTLLVRKTISYSPEPELKAYLFHWGLYPKLPDKPLYVEYKPYNVSYQN